MIFLPFFFLSCSQKTKSIDTADILYEQDFCSINYPTISDVFTENDSCNNGICFVAEGEFVMGDSNTSNPDQCPPHLVYLDSYSIDETEVTIEKYKDCVEMGFCDAIVFCPSLGTYEQEELLPITCVNWYDAQNYCSFVGGRLPTEAEWEKAARGTTGSLWPWGNQIPDCSLSNFRNVSSYCQGGVVEVASYAENSTHGTIRSARSLYGLLDVAGNAWEWTADWYDARYYQRHETKNPTGPDTCSVEQTQEFDVCQYKSIRGGSYNSQQDAIRTTARGFLLPDQYDNNIGFRCAYDE